MCRHTRIFKRIAHRFPAAGVAIRPPNFFFSAGRRTAKYQNVPYTSVWAVIGIWGTVCKSAHSHTCARHSKLKLLCAKLLHETLCVQGKRGSLCTMPALIQSPNMSAGNLLSHERKITLERAHESVINRHHGTSVVKLSAIVGRTEHSNELPARKEFVTVFHNLQDSPQGFVTFMWPGPRVGK